MIMAGIHVKQVETDADTLIVSTAMTTGVSDELPDIVVGTHTDVQIGRPLLQPCACYAAIALQHCTTFMKCIMLSETQPNT